MTASIAVQPQARVAVVQAAPVMLDPDATIDRMADWTQQAAHEGAELVLFPEAFVSAYPRGLTFGTAVGNREPWGRKAFAQYWEGAVAVPSRATERMGGIAREHGVYLAVGVVERDATYSGGTLYCTLLVFGPDGRLLGKHRKLKPTGAERLVWGEGDGSTLPVFPTPLGNVGGLICWENYMPLARAFLYGKGVEVYLAPTADPRDAWQATIRHVALEGRCFVLACNQYLAREHLPPVWRELEEYQHQPEVLCRGGSAIVGPLGDYLAGPLYDEEGLLLATLEREALLGARYDFDPVGHYARPDVFRLVVDESPHPPQVVLHGHETPGEPALEEPIAPTPLAEH